MGYDFYKRPQTRSAVCMGYAMSDGQWAAFHNFPLRLSLPSLPPTILLCKHNHEVQQCPAISSIFMHLLRICLGTLEVHDIYFSKNILHPEASSPSQALLTKDFKCRY
ncbi:hypothetical protein OCU04_011565 [Sclerotinia nivalis]|uniref:Uncharacterized protein n=1 Tax=Sclerotinia nivalis TaxID=352851 RepID=A0A9X0ABZ9_9HELO|nr:hypothetical protein OCU04_011565 [Sclerotinia nivalis]